MSSTVARAGAGAAVPVKKSPSEFLKSLVGRPVVVRLASGVDYRGILICLDGFMNVALEQAEEWVRFRLLAPLVRTCGRSARGRGHTAAGKKR